MSELQKQYDEKLSDAEKILDAAVAENRGLTKEEGEQHDALVAEARAIRQTIVRRDEIAKEREEILPELRSARAAAEPTVDAVENRGIESIKQRDPGHYTKRSDRSWFVDLHQAQNGNDAARRRLGEQQAHNDTLEKRDLYIGSTTGQELSPPVYLQEMFVEGRIGDPITANLCNRQPLPDAGRTLTIPKMTGNTGVGIQAEASPLTAGTETDATFDAETQSIHELLGVQDLSNFLADRSVPGADMIIARNLAKQVNAKKDYYVLVGDGTGEPQGIRGATGINAVTWTEATPTFAAGQAKVADMLQQIHSGWFEAPDALVMAPRRWAKWLSERDTDGRLQGGAAAMVVNPMAIGEAGAVAMGLAGALHGVPVYLDPHVPLTSGSGTNEDTIFAFKRDAALLYEGAVILDIDRSVNFKTSGIAVRARQYFAFFVEHAPEAFGTVSGTGLAAPTFS